MAAYVAHYLVMVGIYAILALSLNLLVGYAGIFSLAHAAIYGIGAYASALVALKLGFGFWGGLLVAAAVGAFAAALVAIPSLRAAGDYYVVASFGLQVVILTVFMNWTDLTNGHAGLPGIPRPNVFGRVIDTPFEYVTLALALATLTYLVCRRLTSSAFGRVLQAIRDDEIAAEAIGKNVVLVKIVVATMSSALGALAGSLYAHYITYINPSSFTLHESIFIVTIVILGGTERLAGPLVGAFILLAIPEALKFLAIPDTVAAPARQILYGGLLVLFMFVRPEGILGRARPAAPPAPTTS
ncbi:MAG: branched-chain amino acid ABC transporter permease [Candidatus Rokubacteria bacterium]|nr:branched-chain amino acid ABC transporter permease [Candidatus Rokubacteria bacterium]